MAVMARGRVVLKYVGYVLFTLVMTLYFFITTFPYKQVTSYVLPQLSKTLPFSVDVSDISATPFFGIATSGVTVYAPAGDGSQKGTSPLLTFQHVTLRPSLLSLLLGKQAVNVHGRLYGGELKGTVAKKGPSLSLLMKWKAIAVDKYERAHEKMKIDGTLAGDIDLHIQNLNPALTEGSITLTVTDGSIKELQVYSFPVPEVTGILGTSKITIVKGKATFEDVSLRSNEVTATLTGDITLASSLVQSRMNINGTLKLSGALASQYDSMLQGFLRNKNKDGSYPFSLRGTLAQPHFGV